MPWYPWHLPNYDLATMPGPGPNAYTPFTSVSRMPGHTELFYIAPDGSVNILWFYGTEKPGGITQIAPPGRATVGGSIVAASRAREYMEVWWTGPTNTIEHAWWYEGIPNNQWRSKRWLDGTIVSRISGMAVQVRNLTESTLFWIGQDGSVNCHNIKYSADPRSSTSSFTWTVIAGPKSAKIGSAIAHTARKANTQEIQWIGIDGSIENAFRYDAGGWIRQQMVPPGAVKSGRSGICGVARKPEIMDVFWVAPDGSVQGMYWFEGIKDNKWVRQQIAAPGSANPDSALTVVSRVPFSVELWWIGPQQSVESAFWYENDVYKRYQLSPPNTADADTRIWAYGQYGNGMGVFWAGVDNHIRHKFFRDVKEKAFPGTVISGGAAALGGWTNLTIRSDGSVWWRGNAHNSGADKYTYFLTAVITPRDPNAPPLALTRNGRVIPTRRDDNWGGDRIFQGFSSLLQSSYEEYANGSFHLYTEYVSAFSEALEDIVGWFGRWLIGSVFSAGVAVVVILGVEIGSLAMTGSLVPGARILSGILFMVGPDGTLIALAADAIVRIGSKQRLLTEDEYKWACDEVYGTSLPPRERIVLCDTIGQRDRAFCWPCPNGMISVNIGPDGFNDPLNFNVPKGYKKGETYIHELGHVWQLTHSGIDLVMLAKAISNQIRGKESYDYGPPDVRFAEFTLEGQASIISHWTVGVGAAGGTGKAKDPMSTYYKYILHNVQPGTYS